MRLILVICFIFFSSISYAEDLASDLFKRCASCHGNDASLSVLNKSKVIKGWSADKIYSALKGYQDGTYGGSMKGIMKLQIKDLSDKQLKEISEYISNL